MLVYSGGSCSPRSTPPASQGLPTAPSTLNRRHTGKPHLPSARHGAPPGAPDVSPRTPLTDWPTPHATGPVNATVALPGSKSLTNRYLVLAALASDASRLRRPLRSRDTLLMATALRSLGTSVIDVPGSEADCDDWLIGPASLSGAASVDCGLAGTVMRFLPPVAALGDGPVVFDGDPHAHQRPMAQVIDSLRTLGATINDGGRGTLPFTVEGSGRMPGGSVTIDASASSQFISALLLAGPQRAAHCHDRRGVARLRCGRGRLADQHVAGRPLTDPRPRRRGRAGPVQRRRVPGRSLRHRRHPSRPGVAATHHPGRRRDPRHLRRDGRRRAARALGPDDYRQLADQWARCRPARRRRADTRHRCGRRTRRIPLPDPWHCSPART